MEEILKIKDLSVSFYTESSEIEVVRGIDYSINKGEIIGILGESGSGKTVSSKSILGLIDSQDGKVTCSQMEFNNIDISNLSEKEYSKLRGNKISFIFQNPTESLNPYIKIGRQLREALTVHNKKVSKEFILNTMKEVGILNAEEIYNRYPFQLSGGQNQRVMIAQGIICNPELLIADEPTSSIDASIRKKILTLFKEINSKHGISIVIITHDFDVAEYICDRIIIMYGGLIVEEGLKDDIISNPLHPYTQELISCVKSLDALDHTLYSLDGTPPNPSDFKSQCPFWSRCKFRIKECEKKIPETIVLKNRKVRCLLRGENHE